MSSQANVTTFSQQQQQQHVQQLQAANMGLSNMDNSGGGSNANFGLLSQQQHPLQQQQQGQQQLPDQQQLQKQFMPPSNFSGGQLLLKDLDNTEGVDENENDAEDDFDSELSPETFGW
jgi:hypothetical protein